jgi:hypothetical protein
VSRFSTDHAPDWRQINHRNAREAFAYGTMVDAFRMNCLARVLQVEDTTELGKIERYWRWDLGPSSPVVGRAGSKSEAQRAAIGALYPMKGAADA